MNSKSKTYFVITLILCFLLGPIGQSVSYAQNNQSRLTDADELTTEDFIARLRENGTVGFWDNPAVNVFKSTCATVATPVPGDELGAFCRVIVNSPICSEIPEEERLDCQNPDESRDFNALEFIRGCATGIFDGVMEILNFVWDVLGWVWDTIREPSQAIQAGSEYAQSAKLYLVNEYDQAYEEASSPFRQTKAAYAVAGSIFDMLMNSIQEFFYREYQEFGCMNFEARTQTMCSALTQIIVPPVSAFYLIKGAYHLVSKPRALKGFFSSRKAKPQFTQKAQAESVLRRELTEKELSAIDEAHLVGAGEIGLDGGPAGIGNYTLAQLRKKARLLREAGLSSDDIRNLMEEGVVGISPNGFGRLFGRGNESGSNSPLSLEADTNSPQTNQFREAFNNGDFTGEASYISYELTSTIREPVRVLRKDGNQLVVERPNGEVFNLNSQQISSARTSSASMESFGLAQSVNGVRYSVGQKVMIPRSSGGSSPGSIDFILPDGRAKVSFIQNGQRYEKTIELGRLRQANPLNVNLADDSRPAFQAFREAFNNGDFSGDNQFISFREFDERLAGRVVGIDENGLKIDVAGATPPRQVVIKDLAQLEELKVSSTAKDFYQRPQNPEVTRRLADNPPNQSKPSAMDKAPNELLNEPAPYPLEIQMSNGRHYGAEITNDLGDGRYRLNVYRDGKFHSVQEARLEDLRPYTPRQGRYNVQRLIDEFRRNVDTPNYVEAQVGMKDFRFPTGRTNGFLHYASDVQVAKAQGRIFDNLSPSELPPGTYTYVITETGEVSYGLVTDGLEFGVKHLHIAQGRRIAVAGEIKVDGAKGVTYNELSGTFTNQAIQTVESSQRMTYQTQLLNLARRFFESDPNISRINRVERTVFPEPPNNQPRSNDIKAMCEYLRLRAPQGDERFSDLSRLSVCQ